MASQPFPRPLRRGRALHWLSLEQEVLGTRLDFMTLEVCSNLTDSMSREVAEPPSVEVCKRGRNVVLRDVV